MNIKSHILPTIIVSQFACTSLWFAGNAIIDELTVKTGMGNEIVGYVISSVQFGFITGTMVFAFLMIADRFSPSKVFIICAILAAICNSILLYEHLTQLLLLSTRFGTGFFLAGIYPVGMKIAADYYEKGLGKALGFLVGALVLGAAFPYMINGTEWGSSYTTVIKATSILAVLGGFAMWILVPNGPYRQPSTQLQLWAGPALFRITAFRKAAFGYFGHMWELYAFWAFTPLAIQTFNQLNGNSLSVPLWTGISISLGALSCVFGGYASLRIGSYRVASRALLFSGMACLLSPLLFKVPSFIFLIGWFLWSMAVTVDSPQFSNLVAKAIPSELKGTGLTLVNSIGFAISILSIQLVSFLTDIINPIYLFSFLAIGPIFGLLSLWKKSS